MPSREVNAATHLAETSWRGVNKCNENIFLFLQFVTKLFFSMVLLVQKNFLPS